MTPVWNFVLCTKTLKKIKDVNSNHASNKKLGFFQIYGKLEQWIFQKH